MAACAAEAAEHERVLAEIDKASRGQVVWRQTPAIATFAMAQ